MRIHSHTHIDLLFCIPYCMTRSLFPPHMADTAAPHSRGALEPTFACVVQPSPSCNPYYRSPKPAKLRALVAETPSHVDAVAARRVPALSDGFIAGRRRERQGRRQ